MLRRVIMISILISIALLAWGAEVSYFGPRRLLHRLEAADPVTDADSAVARRDFRFISVDGWAYVADSAVRDSVARSCRVYNIPYTAHVFRSEDDVRARLTNVARQYSRRYNQRLVERLPLSRLCAPGA